MSGMAGRALQPDWPAPSRVHAWVTTRQGGVSKAPFNSLNLATHVGDDPAAVALNRDRLREQLALPAEPVWLSQVHGTGILDASRAGVNAEADGSFACRPNVVCAVLTADCLPVLLADREGRCVAAVHAGWRGLADGVVEAAVTALPVAPADLLVWLGPAIGPDAFEVGDDVYQAFVGQDPETRDCFREQGARWLADIYGLARRRLARLGITAVYGGGLCTHTDTERFYSYRRDGRTGRLASLIWLD